MSYDEIQEAALARPEDEQERLLERIVMNLHEAHPSLTPAQAADLERRVSELEAHPEVAEDGDVVMARLFAEFAPNTPQA